MKFPRTYHLPWSPGATSDDKKHRDISFLLDTPLVITEKLDGENQCWSRDNFHLRSESSNGGQLRSRAKAKWAEVRAHLSKRFLFYIEDISNVHSIEYEDYSNLFFLIGLYDLLDQQWLEVNPARGQQCLGLPDPPRLYEGVVKTEAELEALTNFLAKEPSSLGGDLEGLVITPAGDFKDWSSSTAKWVRANHIKTNNHWLRY